MNSSALLLFTVASADQSSSVASPMNARQLLPATTSTKVSPWDDVSWILTASFLIFTMQSGYGLLQAGTVSPKNEINILVKNGVNLALGGLCFWLFGYGLSFGTDSSLGNPVIGWGNAGEFLVDAAPSSDDDDASSSKTTMSEGDLYSKYVFQLAYATSSTTIVSGCMAERCKFLSYCLFSFWNTLSYCVPAGWIWGEHGFLRKMGVVDIGGSGTVHLSGAVAGLVGAWFLGPRLGRFQQHGSPNMTHQLLEQRRNTSSTIRTPIIRRRPPMGNPTSAVMGLFMLWWGWLGFNAGATFGISGNKWIYASKSTVVTILSSIGGGLTVMGYSLARGRGLYRVEDMIDGVIGALVAVSGGSPLFRTWEALMVGAVGAALALAGSRLLDNIGATADAISTDDVDAASSIIIGGGIPTSSLPVGEQQTEEARMHLLVVIDDPVRSISVHGFAGLWGLIVIGLFASHDDLVGYTRLTGGGLFKTGSLQLLGLQLLAAACIVTWSGATSGLILWVIDRTLGLRCAADEEIAGQDYADHSVRRPPENAEEGIGHQLRSAASAAAAGRPQQHPLMRPSAQARPQQRPGGRWQPSLAGVWRMQRQRVAEQTAINPFDYHS